MSHDDDAEHLLGAPEAKEHSSYYEEQTPLQSPSVRLSFWAKLSYGVAEVPGSLTGTMAGFFLNPFLLEVVQLGPGTVGTMFFLVTTSR